jgi:hypothetical protein
MKTFAIAIALTPASGKQRNRIVNASQIGVRHARSVPPAGIDVRVCS